MLLTIISVCYNDKSELKKTIESIRGQVETENHMEYIVMDGDSNDGTLEMIDSYHGVIGTIKELRVYSEPDKGIYDAMNKALNKARGDWVFFLNAGDVFFSDTVLADIEKILVKNNYNTEVIYGNVLKYNKWIQQEIMPPTIDFLKRDMILCHQAIFFKRKMHLSYSYDISYELVADYNSVLQMYLDGQKFKYVDIFISKYNMDGASAENIVKTYREITKVRINNGLVEKNLENLLLFVYGVTKRYILMSIPQKIRWKIVLLKRKMVDGEAKY